MKKGSFRFFLTLLCTFLLFAICGVVSFAEEATILDGIYADAIPLGGMTRQEAQSAIDTCIDEMADRVITLYTVNDEEITVTPRELGFCWKNTEIIDEAIKLGNSGNVVSRYKVKKDLAYANKIYDIEYGVDTQSIERFLEENCSVYDSAASEGMLTRVDGHFVINEGVAGATLDVNTSTENLANFLCNEWTGENTAYQLVIDTTNANGSYEQLSLVKDVLGTFHTNFSSSGSNRSANVKNGARLINGSVIFPGENYSFYDHIKPFSAENGYQMAAAYASGKVIDSIGGGICQVSSTLYNTVLYAELEIVERRNHAMIVGYVEPARDATIAESSGIDFVFKNNTDAPIYIEAYTTDGKELYITIYGHETRPAGRTVEYKSEVVSKTVPDTEAIYTDSSLPVGSISVQSAHIGYKANLWKIVTENGETTKELVNTSTYNPAPKYATVGTATDNPTIAGIMQDAIASGNIETVKAAIAQCKSIQSGASVDPNAEALAQYEAALAQQQQQESSEQPSEEQNYEEQPAEE